MTDETHWNSVYGAKDPTNVSWYRPRLERSLAWIEACQLDPDAHVVDVGGGASTLVDDLLDAGFDRVTVVDISERALEHSKARLGAVAKHVNWVVGDATAPLLEDASVDLWHDRAVFHFLTEDSSRDAYVEQLRRSLRPGGVVILATFGPRGPEKCSGLPVRQYSPEDLVDVLGDGFELVAEAEETHVTPWDAPQEFSWVMCKRSS